MGDSEVAIVARLLSSDLPIIQEISSKLQRLELSLPVVILSERGLVRRKPESCEGPEGSFHVGSAVPRIGWTSLLGQVIDQVHDVFISYRWIDPDQTWVREQLAPALRNSGLAVLLDVDDFVPGRDLILEMTRAGRESRHVLCVLSPDYFDGNRMVAFESLMARRLDPSGSEPGLIPLVLRSCELPEWLRGLIPIDWTNPSYHDREWRKLLKALAAPSEGLAPGLLGSEATIPDVPVSSASKYYVYISESKLDMLYPQLGTRMLARQDSIGKLEAVLADLARGGHIGTIDEPKEYFAGSMPMRWGPCMFGATIGLDFSGLVYFGGVSGTTVIGLGGSGKHVIGQAGSAKPGVHSLLPAFMLQLQKELGESLPAPVNLPDFGDPSLGAVYVATMNGKGPAQELEFVAKRLAYGPCPAVWRTRSDQITEKVLVGTPLYVAMCG